MKGKSLILSLMMGVFCLSASAQKVVFDFNGKVTDPNGQGIAGVVVNDGINLYQNRCARSMGFGIGYDTKQVCKHFGAGFVCLASTRRAGWGLLYIGTRVGAGRRET